MTHKLCQNANFENGGTTIQVSILHFLLNILSISSLPRVHDISVNFEMQKDDDDDDSLFFWLEHNSDYQ